MISPKTILVTGCSTGGIGAALALALAKRNNTVIATARTPSKIPSSLSTLPNVTVLALDVCSPPSITAAVSHFTSNNLTLDVVVNNAGGGYAMPLLDASIDRAKELYDLNVWGPLRAIQAFSALLIASKGRVVNISTCGAAVNTPWIGVYSSSKAALTTLSETLRLELLPFGVRVVAIMVGAVDSKFHDNDVFELPRTSLYVPVEEQLKGWASGASKPKGVAADVFVESIVEDVVGDGAVGLVWKGPHAGSIKYLSRFAPQSVADAAMSYTQGLAELKAHVDAKE
ncbi:unnamed protein product [Periconia digitata]|uniref:Uncharacterized protein n=1 Tax=Periconia digitata TaxID=1303443 RepID=A0A9W4UNP1_9PLEO|nr:unnamed protein product [Periconia digitata]